MVFYSFKEKGQVNIYIFNTLKILLKPSCEKKIKNFKTKVFALKEAKLIEIKR